MSTTHVKPRGPHVSFKKLLFHHACNLSIIILLNTYMWNLCFLSFNIIYPNIFMHRNEKQLICNIYNMMQYGHPPRNVIEDGRESLLFHTLGSHVKYIVIFLKPFNVQISYIKIIVHINPLIITENDQRTIYTTYTKLGQLLHIEKSSLIWIDIQQKPA